MEREGLEVQTYLDAKTSKAKQKKGSLPHPQELPCAEGTPGLLTLWGDDLHFDLFGGIRGCVEGLVLLLCRWGSIAWSSCGTEEEGQSKISQLPLLSKGPRLLRNLCQWPYLCLLSGMGFRLYLSDTTTVLEFFFTGTKDGVSSSSPGEKDGDFGPSVPPCCHPLHVLALDKCPRVSFSFLSFSGFDMEIKLLAHGTDCTRMVLQSQLTALPVERNLA